eukprot:15484435-Alexandrium_andersonii.AAC.1
MPSGFKLRRVLAHGRSTGCSQRRAWPMGPVGEAPRGEHGRLRLLSADHARVALLTGKRRQRRCRREVPEAQGGARRAEARHELRAGAPSRGTLGACDIKAPCVARATWRRMPLFGATALVAQRAWLTGHLQPR